MAQSWNGSQFFRGPTLSAGDLNSAVTFAIQQGQAAALASLANGQAAINVGQLSAVMGLEVGNQAGRPGGAFLDFHVDGTTADYNTRFQAIPFAGATGATGYDLLATSTRFTVDGTLRAGRFTMGQGDTAAVASFIANSSRPDHGGEAGVLGYTPGLGASSYGDIDSVSLYVETTGRLPLFVLSGVTFQVTVSSARMATSMTQQQVGQLFHGMQILTNHTVPYTGWIDTWAPDGSWVQVIGGFTHLPGNPGVGQDPTTSPVQGGGAVQVAFAPITKVWAQNANCFLGIDTAGNRLTGPFVPKKCAGIEFGMLNNTGTDHLYDGQETNAAAGYSWGVDAVNLGSNRGGSGHIARGFWDAGFHAQTSGRYGFLAEGAPSTSFAYAIVGGPSSPSPVWSVDFTGLMIARAVAVSAMPTCLAETRPGFVCKNGRTLEIN